MIFSNCNQLEYMGPKSAEAFNKWCYVENNTCLGACVLSSPWSTAGTAAALSSASGTRALLGFQRASSPEKRSVTSFLPPFIGSS